MNKYIITFGSGQLGDFNVSPNNVALVIEAENESIARGIVFDFPGIGSRFCTSYDYSYIEDFISKYDMKVFTLDDLENLRKI